MPDAGQAAELRTGLTQTWDTGVSGTYEVQRRVVQWSRRADGLLVEVVSNAFLGDNDALGVEQLDMMLELGFATPGAGSPHHHRTYGSRDELADAARLLSRVVRKVLAREVDRPGRDPGRVCVVVGLAKVSSQFVEEKVGWMHGALRDRTDAVLVIVRPAAYDARRLHPERTSLESWMTRPDLVAPKVLVTTAAPDNPELHRYWAEGVVLAVERLRRRGKHVLFLSPTTCLTTAVA